MKRSAIIVLLLLGLAGPGVSGVRAEDLTVALSSLSTETLDPVLGGHIVKFYLDQIFDYLVGVTPDGQLSADVGSAPYRFVEQVTGSHIKLEAVPAHWRAGTPKYRVLTFKIVPEESTRLAMLRRGEVDIMEVSRERVKELQRSGMPIVTKRQDAHVDFWWILPWTNAPIRDKRVREALNIAIDRAELIDSVFAGMAEPGAVPYAMASAMRDVKFRITPEHVYQHDPARAKRLLSEAGYANGFSMELYAYQLPGLPEGRTMAEALAGYWHKIGVQTTLVPVDYVAFRQKWFDRSAPGALGYYNQSNRDWLGTFAMIDKWTDTTV